MSNYTREKKGSSLLALPDNYVVIDVETTGLDPRFHELIELGAVQYENGVEISRFQSLVKPQYPVDEFIESMTGITNEMLAGAPELFNVLPAYLDFIGGNVLIGHNVNFDINFLYDNAEDCGLSPVSNNFVDTLRLSRILFADLPNHRLQTIKDFLGVGSEKSHRAIADCLDTNACYNAMKQHALDNNILLVRPKQHTKISDITAQTDSFDESHPIFGKCFVFTGKLGQLPRVEAQQIVVDHGGLLGCSVTKETDFLVIGDLDFCSQVKDGKSNKQKKAEKLALQGFEILTISESVFLDMLK